MSTKRIIDVFAQWQQDEKDLAMATVFATEGSTYSKAGHRIIITADGNYQGLVSGGCLEGDLAEHARTVIDSGVGKAVTYDLRDEADEIWGMGIGCNGIIKVLLQRLDSKSGYEPFQTIAKRHLAHRAAICATVVDSEDANLPIGATLIDWGDDHRSWQVPSANRIPIRDHCANIQSTMDPRLVVHEVRQTSFTVLYAPIIPLPRLLILGAGPDAIPLVRMAEEIGWLVTVVDHRTAYLEADAFSSARTLCIEPTQLKKATNLAEFSAIVVMSHQLAADRIYLGQLSGRDIPYLGVLGPRARRDRLISELNASNTKLEQQLKGPVGLDIGADSPESIALSILAQIHKTIIRPKK
jgi:xanthine dehydrogenase accessory factor